MADNRVVRKDTPGTTSTQTGFRTCLRPSLCPFARPGCAVTSNRLCLILRSALPGDPALATEIAAALRGRAN